MSHYTNLRFLIPELDRLRIVDIGSGRDEFLLEATKNAAYAAGVEMNPVYIDIQNKRATQVGVAISLQQGKAESMPFEDNSFDFANLSELIEHVENPARVLAETFRVLAPGGRAYVSVPMRFSFRDPHYKVYGVNWVPRAFSDSYLRFFNGMKPFAEGAGRQRLADMHYYTYGGFAALARSAGFQVVDSREMKLRRSFSGYIGAAAVFVYTAFLRPLYFDTFHVILTKPE